jgi:peptidoglycan/xylan/chitin deacetylase (PgdA/CDA1 family)
MDAVICKGVRKNINYLIMNGKFVISLDFELMWGLRDLRTAADFADSVAAVRAVIPRLLAVFERYQITATFATVGFLFFEDKDQLKRHLPTRRPAYEASELSPYGGYIDQIGENEGDDQLHYGLSLISQICRSGHEVATHTFSHYYCLEPGQSPEEFQEDLEAAISIAGQKGIPIRSIVFPRNQYSADYIRVCGALGLSSFRGNEPSWIYVSSNGKGQHLFKRACRLLDSYIHLSGPHIYDCHEIKTSYPYNIPASAFLRPFDSRLSRIEKLKIGRIKKGMSLAARQGKVYHLWWHPHNFGTYMDENFRSLTEILSHYSFLKERYHFESLSMAALADKLKTL